jgi:flavin-dependent dehydrogenase
MAGPEAPDYVVAGAGPAGMTIARLLALKGRRVVVAAGEQRRDTNRLELLAPAARRTVAALGLEPLLRDKAIARPCLGVRRPQVRTEYEDFLQHPDREGHVVDRTRFDTCLRDAALAAGAEVLTLRAIGVDPHGGGFVLGAKRGHGVRCL